MKTSGRITEWLEHRTGAFGSLRQFLEESIPVSVGWRNTLGAVAGSMFLVQVFTGILLALYYVPDPEGAPLSIAFIQDKVQLGALTRALHYWGASFMIVALFVHMIRVFVSGAYKKPREVTWIVGLTLFALVLGIAFTGQLLPWNQEGYWAALVGAEIAGSPPVIGPVIKQLMLGAETVGTLSLTRFYALHVVALPLLLGVLIVAHIYLLRRHGPVRPATDSTDETVYFFPGQVFRDLVAASVILVALVVTALVFGGPEDIAVDPYDTEYVPRPAWYFLAHFELLRFTPGSLKLVSTFIIPSLLGALLALLPWIDRSQTTRVGGRKAVFACGMIFFGSVVALTASGLVREAGEEPVVAEVEEEELQEEADGGPSEDVRAGRTLFRRLKCMDCHRINGRGKDLGPDLSNVGYRLKEPYLRAWIKDPISFNPETTMPLVEITDAQLDQIVAYLMTLESVPEP